MVESSQTLAGPLKLINNHNKRMQFNLLQSAVVSFNHLVTVAPFKIANDTARILLLSQDCPYFKPAMEAVFSNQDYLSKRTDTEFFQNEGFHSNKF